MALVERLCPSNRVSDSDSASGLGLRLAVSSEVSGQRLNSVAGGVEDLEACIKSGGGVSWQRVDPDHAYYHFQ